MKRRTLGSILVLSAAWAAVPAAGQEASRSQVLGQARQRAIQEILVAVRSEDPFLRANAIEAIQPVAERVLPMVQLGMTDTSPVVRFTALVTAGKLGLRELGPAATRYIDDESGSVQAAAIFAAREAGLDVSPKRIPALLLSRSSTVRRNTAMIVGLMGNSSAVPMLRNLSRSPMPQADSVQQAVYRLQIAEAILRLGDDEAIDTVRGGAYSKAVEVRVFAISILGEARDRRMALAIQQMIEDPTIEVRLAAATALAKFGQQEGSTVIIQGAGYRPEDIRRDAHGYLRRDAASVQADLFRNLLDDPAAQEAMAATIRAQAAFGLGLIRNDEAARLLVGLLADPNPRVRISAAAAVLRALDEPKRRTAGS